MLECLVCVIVSRVEGLFHQLVITDAFVWVLLSAWPFCCQTHLPFLISLSLTHTNCLFEVTTTWEQLWNTSHQGLIAFILLTTVPLSGRVCVCFPAFPSSILCWFSWNLKTIFPLFTATDNVDYVTKIAEQESVVYERLPLIGKSTCVHKLRKEWKARNLV